LKSNSGLEGDDMTERRRLSEEQLRGLDSLIAVVARQKIAGEGRPVVEDWWDVAEAFAEEAAEHFAQNTQEIAEWAADNPELLAAVGAAAAGAIGGLAEVTDQLPAGTVFPASVVDTFRQAGPMPSLEDLVLIRQKYQ
jgi:hypothetical protein